MTVISGILGNGEFLKTGLFLWSSCVNTDENWTFRASGLDAGVSATLPSTFRVPIHLRLPDVDVLGSARGS